MPSWALIVAAAATTVAAAPSFLVAATRPAGAGISYALSQLGGCEGAFWFVPATAVSALRGVDARRYGPLRNAPLEATLLAAAAAAATDGPSVPTSAPEQAPSLRAVTKGVAASGEALAAAMQQLVADPSRLGAVAPALIRTVSVEVPRATMRGSARRRIPSGALRGLFEATLEYVCLGVELFATEADAIRGELRDGNKTWVAAAVYLTGSAQVVVPFETAGGEPRPLACGSSVVDRQAIRTATLPWGSPTVVPYTYASTCAETLSGVRQSVGFRCSLAERGSSGVGRVEISPAYGLVSAFRTDELLVRSSNNTRRAGGAAAAVRLRVWRLPSVLALATSASSTTATAREAVAASAAGVQPRLDSEHVIVGYTLVPAVLGFLIGSSDALFVLVKGREARLRWRTGFNEATRHTFTFFLSVAAAAVALAAAVPLYGDFGQETVRGYVALEVGTVVYQAAAPGLPPGGTLRLTVQPVVEGVLVRLGGRVGQEIVIAAMALAAVDLAWDACYVGLSVAWAGGTCGGGCSRAVATATAAAAAAAAAGPAVATGAAWPVAAAGAVRRGQ